MKQIKITIRKYSPAAVLLIFAIFFSQSAHSQTNHAEGGNFTLKSKSGSVSLADFKGKVVVMYFGYVTCGSICPMSLSKISSALRKLSESERKHTAGIFITVDPERDTPEIVSGYASQFDPLITGLSGSLQEITEVAKLYGVRFQKREIKSSMEYSCDHSSNTYIVNQEGKLVKILPHDVSPSDILDSLRKHKGK